MHEIRFTNSSFSNSELYCAASSVIGFWTMFLQTSQMVRLAMNIPISGTNTLIPLPASAPFRLWRGKKKKGGGGNLVVFLFLWWHYLQICLYLLNEFFKKAILSFCLEDTGKLFIDLRVLRNLLRFRKAPRFHWSFRNSIKTPKPILTSKTR